MESDTGLLAFLVLMVPFVIAFVLSTAAQEIETGIRALDRELTVGEPVTPSASPQATLDALRRKLEEVRSASRWTVQAARIVAWAMLAAFYIGLALWRSFIIMRRRFSFELERFALRIQGLASKAELAELAVAESNVFDEETLRAFVERARVIAGRHNVSSLVATFDLWSTQAD